MPDNISLNISTDIRTPGQYIEIDASRAVQGLPTQDRKILVMGQRLATGTVAAEVPTLVTSAAQARTYFGQGSMLARMLAALFGTVGQYRPVYAVALDDDAGGVAATKTITFGGTVTAAGTLALLIAGTRVAVAVGASEAAATTATNVAAAINAKADLPVTAAAVDAVVTLTARNKGVAGEGVDVRHSYYTGEALPTGLTVAIAAGTTGSGNPDVTDAIAAIGEDQFYTIVTPWTDDTNMDALETELDSRWGPLEQRTGHAFAAYDDTVANLITYGDARNSPHSTVMGLYSSPTWAPERAAILAGVVEYHGAIDPARPFQTLALPGILAPAIGDRFTRTERDLLLHDGISTVIFDGAGNAYVERVITTYQETATGIEDISLLDLNTKWTADYIRYAVRARIALRFPRHKLADDGTRFAPGQAIATPKIVRAELLALFRELEWVGLVENFEQYKQDLLVLRSDTDPNRINALIPPDVVNQFRVFAAAVQFRL